MILNEEQLQAIRQKIDYTVKYSETYDEVYDHVISAIENSAEAGIDAEALADNIIAQDFNGYSKLRTEEENRVTQVTKAMRKKHWHNITQFFNVPLIGFTIIITIAAGFIVVDPFRRKCLLGFSMAASIVPLLFIFYTKLSAKYDQWKHDVYKKPSLKDNYIFIAAVLGESMLNVMNFAAHRVEANGALTILVFICYTVYVLSFFKLYQDEFKMNLAR